MRRRTTGLLAVFIALACFAPASSGHDYPAVLTLKEQLSRTRPSRVPGRSSWTGARPRSI